jgi:hypothetical protein
LPPKNAKSAKMLTADLPDNTDEDPTEILAGREQVWPFGCRGEGVGSILD